MLTNAYKVTSKSNSKIQIKVVSGHFATNHSHINMYLDMTRLKVGQREAKEVASTMAQEYQYNKPVDSIICMAVMPSAPFWPSSFPTPASCQ